MEVSDLISPAVAALIALVGSYVAFKNANNARLEQLHVEIAELSTKIDLLTTQVEKHNNVLERVFKLESDMGTAYKRIDELRARDDKLEAKIER